MDSSRSLVPLRVLIGAIVLIDSALFTTLVPLLPRFADEFALSTTGAGVLLAAYALGGLLGAVPAGFASSQIGARRIAMAGLVFVSIGSVVSGFADDAITLGVARLIQGLGAAFSGTGAFSWLIAATPRERRGEMLGATLGAGVFGGLAGPILGVLAIASSPEAVFTAVGGVAAGLIVWARRFANPAPEPQSIRGGLLSALGSRGLFAGLWLTFLSAVLFGVLDVIVPFRLDAAGWSGLAIGAVFVTAGACEVVSAPTVGRLSDRRGRRVPLQIALVGSAALCASLAWSNDVLAVAALTVVAALAYGAVELLAMAIFSDRAEHFGVSQSLAFGFRIGALAAGTMIGPVMAGRISDLAGDSWPFIIGAGLAALTLLLGPYTKTRFRPG